MKNKLTLIAACLLIMLCATLSFSQDDTVTGGYGDADVTDKEVIAAAKFAVKKRGTIEKTTITVASITKARVQVVAGLNYEVCMEIRIKPAGRKSYRRYAKAVVYKNLRGTYKLTTWVAGKTPQNCSD